MNKIGVIIITKNSEYPCFRECLRSIYKISKEDNVETKLIIVDGGSTDQTREIIKKYQAQLNIKLIEHPMGDSFSEQRNIAKKECTGDWILVLDTDETLTANVIDLLPKLMAFAGHTSAQAEPLPCWRRLAQRSHLTA